MERAGISHGEGRGLSEEIFSLLSAQKGLTVGGGGVHALGSLPDSRSFLHAACFTLPGWIHRRFGGRMFYGVMLDGAVRQLVDGGSLVG